MASRIPVTKQTLLLYNSRNYLNKVAMTSLRAFSIRKIIELKLATSNFKTAFDFNEEGYLSAVSSEVKRLSKLIRAHVYKLIPFLENSTRGFVIVHGTRTAGISIQVIGDRSTAKYLTKVLSDFDRLNIPIEISHNIANSHITLEQPISLYLTYSTSGEKTALNLYKLIMLIPDILTVFKTLSRKAIFVNENFTNLNRYVGVSRRITQ